MNDREQIEGRQSLKRSSGEKQVEKFLKSRFIKYEREFSFDELRNPATGRLLFFDFYLLDKKIAIEVDGIYHFKSIDGSNLGGQRYRDRLKNKFCKDKRIKLIRLRYEKQKINVKKLAKELNIPLKPPAPPKKKVVAPKKNGVPVETLERIKKKADDFRKYVEDKRARARYFYPDDIRNKLGIAIDNSWKNKHP